MKPIVHVTVDAPFDWVGSILVPVAAIAVSSAIALLIARNQRLAGARDRRLAQIGRLSIALQQLAVATESTTISRAYETAVAESNILEIYLDPSDVILLETFWASFEEVVEGGVISDVKALRRTALWNIQMLAAWTNGSIDARSLSAGLPQKAHDAISRHDNGFKPSEWPGTASTDTRPK